MMGNAGSRAWYDTRDPMPPAGLMDEGTVWVRVALDESGLVTAARVERGATRAPSQTSLLTYLRAIVFFPATEDGYPVPGEASIPLRLR
jgi:TonB family protein